MHGHSGKEMYRPATKHLSLIWVVICSLMLCAPELTQALEYNINVPADKSVKKIVTEVSPFLKCSRFDHAIPRHYCPRSTKSWHGI